MKQQNQTLNLLSQKTIAIIVNWLREMKTSFYNLIIKIRNANFIED